MAGRTQPDPAGVNVEGIDFDEGSCECAPPDPSGAVGASQYVQVVNNGLEVFDKTTGASVYGPVDSGSLWNDLEGVCKFPGGFIGGATQVRYDGEANRWVFMKGSDLNGLDRQFHICFAVSQTSDATGAYNLYDFGLGGSGFDNLPNVTRLGLWPDGYYVAADSHSFSTGPAGLSAYAFDRRSMLAGSPAGFVAFDVGLPYQGVLPADWQGDGGATGLPPPLDAPNYFIGLGSPEVDGSSSDVLHTWRFHADFTTPANSTFTGPVDVATAPFRLLSCAGGFFQPCVPQLDSPDDLDAVGDRLMYPAAYRNFGDHEAIVVNHTVNVAGTGDQAGIRWYELRDPAGGPTVFQQGTYAPDSKWRWIGSVGMDVGGNLALGYNKSDATIHPEIDLTGRLASDPPGTLGSELVLRAGGGSQTDTSSAWGRYSTMSVDPTDGCTFWYTAEYYQTTAEFNWKTRIGSFKYPTCAALATGILQGIVTDAATGDPISGARVTAGPAQATTDASGRYRLTLPVGVYDMTVRKYGYLSATASGIAITAGGNTAQNFRLTPAVTATVSGTVTDGSAQGWPLYARIDVSTPGSPNFRVYTDPVTGRYDVMLVRGLTYGFVVEAVYPGYSRGGGPALVAGPTQTLDWQLPVVPAVCTAPGYLKVVNAPVLSEGFSTAVPGTPPAGWTVINNSSDGGQPWNFTSGGSSCGDYSGNQTGGTGLYAYVESHCDGAVSEDTELVSPILDLSGLSSAVVAFKIDHSASPNSFVTVDVSSDGGANWANLVFQGASLPGPAVFPLLDLTPYLSAQVKIRFHYLDFEGGWIQIDDVVVGPADCVARPGGLVVGNVRDANTGAGLNGAKVAGPAGSATTFSVPTTPSSNDGFYFLFSASGSASLTASYTPVYAPQTRTVSVLQRLVVRSDFSLAAGRLTASPKPLVMYLDPGANKGELTLHLTNTGGVGARVQLNEVDFPSPVPPSAPGGVDSEPANADALLAEVRSGGSGDRFLLRSDAPEVPGAPPSAPALAAGAVINNYPTGLNGGFGVGFDTRKAPNDLWVGNPGFLCAGDEGGCGDNKDYRFLMDGTNTGDTIDVSSVATIGLPADLAYDSVTGKLWQLDDSGVDLPAGCLHELDPLTKISTGNTICPPFDKSVRPQGFSQRGLAFDPATETFYSGSRYRPVIHHFDRSGKILDSAYVGLAISGMAYNPTTGHLFVLFGGRFSAFDVYVLDPKNGYNAIGAFNLTQDGSPVPIPARGGMDMDCKGHLWVMDWIGQTLYEVDSGEPGGCGFQDIPWLSVSSGGGTVDASSSVNVRVTFDATGLTPGLRQARLGLGTDTPYQLAALPVDFVVRFVDIADDDPFAPFIYSLAGARITAGCGGNRYCPEGAVTRAQMAILIEQAIHGPAFVPPPAAGLFGDVPPASFGASFIEQLFRDGMTKGCGGGNFCPSDPVSRAQMAVFIVKGVHGAEFVPPAATGIFSDVPPGSFAADYIEQLFRDGVTKGCGGGDFCPGAAVSRAQMAALLVTAFQLPRLP